MIAASIWTPATRTDFGTTLPPVTQLLISTAEIIESYWYFILLTPVVVILALKLIGMSRAGRYFLDNVKLHIPVFGKIISKSTVIRPDRERIKGTAV